VTTASDGGNRTRPCTAIYRTIMVEFERQRLSRGLSMAQVDDLAGTNDGYYAKMLYPDTPNGRQARWETVQDVGDALFGRDFVIQINGVKTLMPSMPGIDKGASSNALQVRHWRHRRHFQTLGALGAKAQHAKRSPEERSKAARKAAKARWKKARAAERAGEQHLAKNAQARLV
jgi:hypothetical protein